MQEVLTRLGQLDPEVGIFLLFAGMVYGLFGWRIIRYLAFADAVAIAVILAAALREADPNSIRYIPVTPAALVLLVGLPCLAWRFPRWAVGIMCGATGFLIVQIVLMQYELPLLARLGLGGLGSAVTMALRMTLSRETAIVVTGLHGGWLCVGALAVMAVYPGSFSGRLFSFLYNTHALLLPAVATCLSGIFLAIQWADLERDLEPVYSE